MLPWRHICDAVDGDGTPCAALLPTACSLAGSVAPRHAIVTVDKDVRLEVLDWGGFRPGDGVPHQNRLVEFESANNR